jgi:lactoylglutathione lyase
MSSKARLVGLNHVALEVGSIEDALAFYGSIFDFTLRSRGRGMAFVDIGDQFIAFSEGREAGPDRHRHFGVVVDDKEAVRRALLDAGIEVQQSGRLNFRDPWGNSMDVVDYRDVQFTKAPAILRGMGLEGLEKHERALAELREKGLS